MVTSQIATAFNQALGSSVAGWSPWWVQLGGPAAYSRARVRADFLELFEAVKSHGLLLGAALAVHGVQAGPSNVLAYILFGQALANNPGLLQLSGRSAWALAEGLITWELD